MIPHSFDGLEYELCFVCMVAHNNEVDARVDFQSTRNKNRVCPFLDDLRPGLNRIRSYVDLGKTHPVQNVSLVRQLLSLLSVRYDDCFHVSEADPKPNLIRGFSVAVVGPASASMAAVASKNFSRLVSLLTEVEQGLVTRIAFPQVFGGLELVHQDLDHPLSFVPIVSTCRSKEHCLGICVTTNDIIHVPGLTVDTPSRCPDMLQIKNTHDTCRIIEAFCM
jgi:hypothetical protein